MRRTALLLSTVFLIQVFLSACGSTPQPTQTSPSTIVSAPPPTETLPSTPTFKVGAVRTPHDVDRLSNGHTLITDGGKAGGDQQGSGSRIIEVDAAGNIVWSFDQGLSWAHNADRLSNGHTLISDTGHDRVIEVDADGNIVWNSDDVTLSDGSHLYYPNDANWLPDDHILITDRDNHRVIEIDRRGNILWQFGETGVPGDDASHLNGPHNADRLSNGNTIIADSNNNRVIEVAPDGTVVWEYRPAGAEALNWPRDADRLPNGHTLITDSRNGRVIEVTQAGQVVWEYADLNLPYDADYLPNGRILISGAPGGKVIEVDENGRLVWQYPSAQRSSSLEEPPINITFNIHFDPVLDNYEKWRERKDNLLWLQSFVEGYSGIYRPKLNLQMQGDQAEFYLDLSDPEAAEGRAALAALYEAGHTFGTHAHNIIRGEAPHSWHVVQGTPTAAQSVEYWQDHLGYVEQLYATITGNDDPVFLQQMNASAMIFLPPGMEAQRQAFAGTYSDPATGETVPHGFTIQTGGPDERFSCLFDHEVENPWRPGTRGALDEDLTNTAFVRIPGLPPLGKIGVHGQIPDCYQDTSLPSYQRMFIQTFLERLYHEYTGAQDKVWTFGWHEHLFDLYPTGTSGPGRRAFREDVQQMVDWLNERFIGRTTANGNAVARYATMTEVRDEFQNWEQAHPGVSSFELTQYNADWEDYPYDLKGLARALANAHYDAALLPPDSILQVYRFVRCPSSLRGETQGYWAYESDGSFGCYDSISDKGDPTGNPLPTTTVYVAWRDAADPEPTDLTPYVGHYAMAYDGVTGQSLGADDVLNALPLNYRPVILLPGPAGPTPTPTSAGYLIISYNANYLWGPPVNVHEATADRFVSTLNRHLDLMDSLGIPADYYFTGLAAEHLADWSPETVTRLLNSDHGIHYHGANRPPYPQLVDQVQGQDWEADVTTAWTYEAEGANPATGEHVGGMAAFLQVFGSRGDAMRRPYATGRFFEASILYVDKQLGARMGVGLKDNTGASRDDAWFLGVLNRPAQAGLSASGLAQAAIEDRADEYLAYARSVLTGVGGPMPLVAFPIHDHDFFDHSPADQEKVWALYEQVLRLALDLGFQPLTMREVYARVRNGPAPTLTRDDLLAAAQSLVDTMEATGYPPEYVEAGGVPYALAEIFEALARALAYEREMGTLPDSVETHDLLGPTEYLSSDAMEASLSIEAVLEATAAVAAGLTEKIPSQVAVGGFTVNPAECLYLMAQAYAALSGAGPASVTLRPVSLLPLSVIENEKADPLTKLQFWTYKPAMFAE